MLVKVVTCVCKDIDGDIIAIGGEGWKHDKHEAISNIENKTYEYYVEVDGQRVRVLVIPNLLRELLDQPVKKHLRTNRDETEKNNLDALPECLGC